MIKRALLTLTVLAPLASGAEPMQAMVDVCFVPAERCAPRIVAAIDDAKQRILVESYQLSSTPILAALDAATRRGVIVRILVDRRLAVTSATQLAALQQAGADIWIARRTRGIAHVKAIVIDGRLTIGGSYNYTESAEHRNVEDVTFTDSPSIAASFEANCSARRLGSDALFGAPSEQTGNTARSVGTATP
jgi:phosphatidylserine/phosphatidylglycerophosphate/cardiolipin synthase-like enzyme